MRKRQLCAVPVVLDNFANTQEDGKSREYGVIYEESNVDENPKTGEITIFVVWVVAAMAIVYSIWYFKQVRES